jgi:predicted RNase H-like HicB family nuclease
MFWQPVKIIHRPACYTSLVVMNIETIVEPGEDGYLVAHVRSLKSSWSQGKTKDEALQNIREAIDLYLEPGPLRSTCDVKSD